MEEFYAVAPKTGSGKAMEKLAHRLGEQEAALSAAKEEEHKSKEKGDLIYSNYQLVEAALAAAKSAGINKIEEGTVLGGMAVAKVDRKKRK